MTHSFKKTKLSKNTGRFYACTCGHCGLIWDKKYDICIAHFVGESDKEQPLAEVIRQRYMKLTVQALNKFCGEFR